MTANEHNILRIGIDFGGVLSVHDRICNKQKKTDQIDTTITAGPGGYPNGEHRSTLIDMPNALTVLEELKKTKIEGIDKIEYYVISFAGKTRAKETKDSIIATCPQLFDGLYFTKSKMNKKFVCKYLGIHIMIDDSLDILTDILNQSLKDQSIMPKLILFSGDPGFAEANKDNDLKINQFKNIASMVSWKDLSEFIKQTDWSEPEHAVRPDTKVDLSKFIYKI